MNGLIRILALTTLLALLVMFGYWRISATQKDRALAELSALNVQLEQTLAQRQAMIDRLSRSRRLAHVRVVEQTRSEGAVASTTIEFIELDDEGSEIDRQNLTVPGDVLFVDAWTIKFDAEQIAAGSGLRGHALVLLRRVYSDQLPPKEGIPLDVPGAIPAGYAASDVADFERQLWENFWELASDPDLATQMGVRVAQGEAVYKPVRAGETYELLVDAVGGMSLKPLPLPATAMSATRD